MKIMISILGIFLLVGCTSTRAKNKAVSIASVNPSGCDYLGEATGSKHKYAPPDNKVDIPALQNAARDNLKDKAARMGGNVVVINDQKTTTNDRYLTESRVTGRVYDCP